MSFKKEIKNQQNRSRPFIYSFMTHYLNGLHDIFARTASVCWHQDRQKWNESAYVIPLSLFISLSHLPFHFIYCQCQKCQTFRILTGKRSNLQTFKPATTTQLLIISEFFILVMHVLQYCVSCLCVTRPNGMPRRSF